MRLCESRGRFNCSFWISTDGDLRSKTSQGLETLRERNLERTGGADGDLARTE